MNSNTEEQIKTLVSERLLLDTNHDIYIKRMTAVPPVPGFEEKPHCIYFYYVRINNDGKVVVDHYFYVHRNPNGDSIELPHSAVQPVIEALARNARPSVTVKNPPRLSTHNFDPIPWDYRSYIAIFFDEANWAFQRRDDGKAAVVFDPVAGAPNSSFFDAEDLLLQLPNLETGIPDTRSAIFFVNHLKVNANGDDLPDGELQKFKFDMWLNAAFAAGTGTGMSVNFDPGGTNQGPPEDPP